MVWPSWMALGIFLVLKTQRLALSSYGSSCPLLWVASAIPEQSSLEPSASGSPEPG